MISLRVLGSADASEYRAFRLEALRMTPAAFTSTYAEAVGKALVTRIIELATATDGVRQVVLTASEGNVAAERLYRSCGFEQWGREPAAVVVDGLPVAKLHMIRWL